MRYCITASLLIILSALSVAQCLRQIFVPISDAELHVLETKARAGDAVSAYSLGMAYIYRTESPNDPFRGVAWLQRAADKGMAEAEYALSNAYASGCGVPKDEHAADAHLLKAAEGGHTHAQYTLAARNEIEKRYLEAAEWYLKAALQGLPEAQDGLGQLYEHGNGVPQDYVKAVEWYRKAAEHGSDLDGSNRLGKNALGLLYMHGDGVPKDRVEAYKWFALAGIESNLRTAASETTAKEILEAQRRVAEWQKQHQK